MEYIEHWKKKNVNQEFCIKQNYASKNEGEIKIFQINKGCGSSPLQEMLNGILHAEMKVHLAVTQRHAKKKRTSAK